MKNLIVVLLLASGYVHASEDLARKNGCLACHNIDNKVIGPSYKDVAKKYQSDKDAVAKLVKKVREGGSGVWGSMPMPPHSHVSESDTKSIVQWILKQK